MGKALHSTFSATFALRFYLPLRPPAHRYHHRHRSSTWARWKVEPIVHAPAESIAADSIDDSGSAVIADLHFHHFIFARRSNSGTSLSSLLQRAFPAINLPLHPALLKSDPERAASMGRPTLHSGSHHQEVYREPASLQPVPASTRRS
ncbi:hypothetical protein HGRIS_005416 [Hohenbuehelia grisea]|uniref:Uncharacterized protein n=1 Tax=Hohenbuehelia grisea TaxID=104357 RepID=A0ABR3JEW8_9AGAR